jgi:hypothetical protein
MFVSFAADSGLRYRAMFWDAKEEKTVERDVIGWVMHDNGAAQAGVLVHEQGLIVPVQSFGNFLCVRAAGTDGLKEAQPLIDAGIAKIKAAAPKAEA